MTTNAKPAATIRDAALKADDRQVLFACHDDEPKPHLHMLINRVSPEDGWLLPSS